MNITQLKPKALICLLLFSTSVMAISQPSGQNSKNRNEAAVARQVLKRVLGDRAASINLRVDDSKGANDYYTYTADNGKLSVTASSTVALTRGVYDYIKSNGLGMVGWSGSNIQLPNQLPNSPSINNESPFRIRQGYNVVTAGYTTPYWTWERWEKELDWQAMHGFNMLMAPVATEAIASRVWKKLGLTQPEIDEFYVGPAHLPWQRMGNIQQVGGTLPPEWHKDQVKLQHKILKRMRELGITPIVQSFAGFVPLALKRLYPNITLHNTLWNAGFPPSQRPVMLMPGDPLFAKITKMYMEEWQKEFGSASYFLVDSFNELELPKTDKPVTELLSEYGEKTYEAIKAGNPNATWVIQGWMFGYQRHIWGPDKVKALFSKVPDDRLLILDYANDYANSWEPVNGFNGKQWVYGFVPNMGGKTAYTGDINLYATGAAITLASPKKNNLVGFSISGEGLENNEVIYELLTDAAWSKTPINLDSWLEKFCINRYGAYPESMKESWLLLRKSSYSKLIDHPQYGWQLGKCGPGSVFKSAEVFESTLKFLESSEQLASSGNYVADALERSALTLGLKADEWFELAAKAYKKGDQELAKVAGDRGLEILSQIDQLLESHPLLRLDRWLNFAREHGNTPDLKRFYESNARRIITVWGPPVNDYSCRVWSGLIRDFYKERMVKVLESLKTGKPFDRKKWEEQWVDGSGISKMTPYPNPLQKAKELVTSALKEQLPQ